MNNFFRALLCCLSVTGAALASAANPAGDEGRLLELINAYRADPPPCNGQQVQELPPLSPEPALEALPQGMDGNPLQALRESGYRAASVQVLRLEGPRSAAEAMRFLRERYCKVLQEQSFSAAGVQRTGNSWQVVLAKPLLPADLPGWREAGKRVLELVNEARSQPRNCGERRFGAADPLAWDARLAAAARGHSEEMAQHDFLSHQGRRGSTPGERARAEDYAWRRVAENVASGQGTAQQVVSGWLSSPGHCANIMNPDFTEMGAAYAVNRAADGAIFWTQVFASPR